MQNKNQPADDMLLKYIYILIDTSYFIEYNKNC